METSNAVPSKALYNQRAQRTPGLRDTKRKNADPSKNSGTSTTVQYVAWASSTRPSFA